MSTRKKAGIFIAGIGVILIGFSASLFFLTASTAEKIDFIQHGTRNAHTSVGFLSIEEDESYVLFLVEQEPSQPSIYSPAQGALTEENGVYDCFSFEFTEKEHEKLAEKEIDSMKDIIINYDLESAWENSDIVVKASTSDIEEKASGGEPYTQYKADIIKEYK